jgi:DNA-binding protein YbaB
MFDKFKAMGAVASILRDKEKLKATTERVKQVSETVRATGDAGGGVVRVTVNGQMKLVSVEIAPALVSGMVADDRTRSLAGNLICEASDKAMATAREKMTEVIRREARDLGLPDDPEALSRMFS